MTTVHPGQNIDVAKAQALLSNGARGVLDVRTPGEFDGAHIPDAVNIPLDRLDGRLPEIVDAGEGTLVVVCQSGVRSAQAAEKLQSAGLTDLAVLDGGMNAWQQAAAPVERAERQHWSLERQVRLAAGALVAGSVLASIAVPKAKFLAGGVGAGLVFAAVSNTCAMGTALGKLPYNRGSKSDIDEAVKRLSR